MAPAEMFEVVTENVFPFFRILGGNNGHAQYMKGARFTNLTPVLSGKIVDFVDNVPIKDRDTNGDLYQYLLGKIGGAGQIGQFRWNLVILTPFAA